jgi:hypothetical protein
MKDRCEVFLCESAERDLAKLSRRDPKRAVRIENVWQNVEKHGWRASLQLAIIKLLRGHRFVGEIRDMGKGATRLIFFWVETVSGYQLYVTRIVPKNALTDVWYNKYGTGASAAREKFLKTGEC